ncbi:MAG: sulfurtransferase TusA family protein [Pseudomonadales bacterium]|nr:sulfurtransferase TusA family protein [Pseudomonadales bacterium]MCP5215259.1 sulfurtransferase TusA family protein [Pseudomonadales bacterium]
MVEVTRRLDATQLRCPLPLLKAKKALNEMAVGEVLEVHATDPGSERDFKVFAQQSCHEMLNFHENAGVFIYLLRKGS